ncbi:uncharacterized protein F4807DRAFT_445018 [Annulohypoxylon truncatum]|uniref:uncharacterized protein n=1 Tax=Annulohypoxylon truncatum TaxID=327061 RepID=UPI002008306E|nr:uncharacterized protein F4807DRAFT_445018 [Annulohypoxylon truncatum]KAI1204921.1 hypothetical protein F4807DRAFT_445018 [Annulohypoxylon truncatum]
MLGILTRKVVIRQLITSCVILVYHPIIFIAQDNRPKDPNNYFIYPKAAGPQYSNDPSVFESNENFTVGQAQAQPFKWVSNMTTMEIILCQEGNPDSVLTHPLTGCFDGSSRNFLYWDGSIGDIDLNNGTQAYLGVWNCSEPGSSPVFFSHYINLINASTTSSTISSTTTMSASSMATAPMTSSTPSTESSPSQASTPSTNGSSNAAAIGGGIGGGIGGALILIAAAFAFWKYRSGRDKGQPEAIQQIADWPNHPEYSAMSPSQDLGVFKPSYQPSELSSHSQRVSELPPSSVTRAVAPDSGRVHEML